MFAEVPTYKFSKNINIVLSASSLGARSLGAYEARGSHRYIRIRNPNVALALGGDECKPITLTHHTPPTIA